MRTLILSCLISAIAVLTIGACRRGTPPSGSPALISSDEFSKLVPDFTFISPKLSSGEINQALVDYVEDSEAQKLGEKLRFYFATRSEESNFVTYVFSSDLRENRHWLFRVSSDNSTMLDKCVWYHH